MTAPGNTTTKLQHWLDLLRDGNDHARTELIGHACERLRLLTSRMLRGYPLVRRWEQTDDVLQNAVIRLHRSLADVTPVPSKFHGLPLGTRARQLPGVGLSRERRQEDTGIVPWPTS